MKLTFFKGDLVGPNFGDELNSWIWPKLLPDFFDENDRVLFLGIGTIIAKWHPAKVTKVVLGAGTTPEIAPSVDDSWKFFAVRGPLSAKVLGLDDKLAVTDPAILVSRFRPPSRGRRFKITLMLHHARSKRANWKLACGLAGINCVDPHDDLEDVLDAIQESEIIFAEAMHFAIVADALRVPWVPLVIHDHINSFKWQDWCLSMGLEYRPIVIRPLLDGSPDLVSRLKAKGFPYLIARKLIGISKSADPVLSSDVAYLSRLAQMLEIIDRLKAAYS